MMNTMYYDRKSKKMVWKVDLTKGEQYDLMKRNNASLRLLKADVSVKHEDK